MKKKLLVAFVAVLILAAMVCLSVPASAAQVAGVNDWLEGASEYNGNYYRLIKIVTDWQSAKDYCEAIGGHLATITSAGEQNFIQSIKGNVFCWLGATDEETEGEWKWVTGEPFVYSNWNSGEPNNVLYVGYDDEWTGKRENSLHMLYDGRWNDYTGAAINGDNGNYIICEWEKEDLDRARSIPVEIDSSIFENGGEVGLYKGHVYKVIFSGTLWHGAKKLCEDAGGHLATISSAGENTIIDWLGHDTDVWLGGTDEETEGVWKWITGEPFEYTRWSSGEPNNSSGNSKYGCDQDWLQMYATGAWDDVWSSSNYEYKSYVCEWEDDSLLGVSFYADTENHWNKDKSFIGSHEYNESGICKICRHREGTLRGFVETEGITRYYYKDDVYATRWFRVEDKWYYFGATDGAMFKGESLKTAGKTYHFAEDHSALEGFIETPDGTMFYEMGCPRTGWVDTDGDGETDSYFYSTTALRCTESRKIGAYYYICDETTGKLTKYTGFLDTDSGRKYYQNGLQVYGWIKPDGTILNGQASVTIKDAYYFAFGDGENYIQITDSSKKIGGIVREFNDDHTVRAYTGWYINKTTGAKNYYVDGAMVFGWQVIDGKTYYFSKSVTETRGYGDMVSGWMRIGGKLYRFLSTGELFEGEKLTVAGREYYFNPDHTVFTGLRVEDGGVRFYNADGVAVTGWADTDGDGARESYFYASTGYKCQESGTYADVNGVRRFYLYEEETDRLTVCEGFYNDGKGIKFYIKGIQYQGWVSADGRVIEKLTPKSQGLYYFTVGDAVNHYMFAGTDLKYDGVVRKFDENHLLIMYSGWMDNEVTGKANYYVNGEKLTGWQDVDGNRYYFTRTDGTSKGDMASGWMRIGGKRYRFQANGALFTGESLNVDGTVYYFNPDHTVFTGLRTEDGGVRFYDADGVLVTGWADTDGNGTKESYFYPSTGYKCRESGTYADVNGVRRFYLYEEDTDSLVVCEGFYHDGVGTKFYVGGVQYTGWVSASGAVVENPGPQTKNAYYFAVGDGVNYYMFEGTEKTIGGIVREFDENHLVKPYTGWMKNKVTGNQNYYIDGEMQTGWLCIEEGVYVYLSRSEKPSEGVTYGDALTGWQKIGGKVYYFRSIDSIPMAALITDAERSLTYEGVRGVYHINQTPESGEMQPSDYYIIDAPF